MKALFQKTSVCAFILLSACVSYREPISKRPIPALEKGDGKMNVIARPAPSPSAVPDLFTRTTELKIKPTSEENETGSLMNLSDDRNYFFTKRTDYTPGQILNIKLASNRLEAPKNPTPAAGAADTGIKGGDDFENTLIKSFPNLEQTGQDKPTLVKDFNVQVTNQYENGDVDVIMQRESKRGEYVNGLVVKARIPYDKLTAGNELTTRDLEKVNWNESLDGEFITRSSPNWEDEYSLRLSGFDEAKSKAAIALQDQRKQLLDIRSKLDTRLRTASTERQNVAKLREDLNRKAKENEEKMADNQKQLDDKTKELADAKKEIEEMKKEQEEKEKKADAEAKKEEDSADSKDAKDTKGGKGTKLTDKPGDKKDGSYGKK